LKNTAKIVYLSKCAIFPILPTAKLVRSQVVYGCTLDDKNINLHCFIVIIFGPYLPLVEIENSFVNLFKNLLTVD
jgi:hypothetical protein